VENQVEEIKKKLDIVEVINRLLPLKKRGRHYVANCPFHQEKTPSFIVSPELQIYKCFGCGKAGDVFSFVQEFNRIDFREALEELAKVAGVKLVNNFEDSREEKNKKTLLKINGEVTRFYHYMLTAHKLGKEAAEYLQKRDIDEKIINKFQIGFSPSDSRLITTYLKKKGFIDEEMVRTGTFGWSQYGGKKLYDRFSGRLTFPLIDFRGRIVGFSGRVLPGAKAEQAKYINSPETELYHKSQMVYGLNLAREATRKEQTVIVVEGEFDMISPYRAGIENIVAIKGTSFTEEQLQLLRRYTDTLILALDSDFAGNNAAIRSIEMAEKLEFEIKVVELPKIYKDPDEAVRDNPDGFKQRIKEAVPIWDFVIDSAVGSFGIETIRGKKEILKKVLPFISRIRNAVIQSDYLKKLAAVLGTETTAVESELKRLGTQKEDFKVTEKEEKGVEVPMERREKMEEELLTLILGSKNIRRVAIKYGQKIKMQTLKFIKIWEFLESKKFTPDKLLDGVAEELKNSLGSMYLTAQEKAMEGRLRKNEIEKIVGGLKAEELKNKLREVIERIGKLEREEKEEELFLAEKEYTKIAAELSKWQKQGK
jgi:DNA primase